MPSVTGAGHDIYTGENTDTPEKTQGIQVIQDQEATCGHTLEKCEVARWESHSGRTWGSHKQSRLRRKASCAQGEGQNQSLLRENLGVQTHEQV